MYLNPETSTPSTILLVDDDPDIRSLTRTFLEHEGYRVFTSGDAERASQIFGNTPQIDLLITDLYMPRRSGLQLAHDLSAIRGDLHVLMISGGQLDLDQRNQMQIHGWRFLSKPFRVPDLLSAVHLMLSPSAIVEEAIP